MQARVGREHDISASLQNEIASLQDAFAQQTEANAKKSSSTASSEALVRDLKLQLDAKDLQLEKVNHEVKTTQKSRDEALNAKDELIAVHQSEVEVSL